MLMRQISDIQTRVEVKKLLRTANNNLRPCLYCGLATLIGMPGGRDSTCENCGYKGPCCYN